MNHPNINTHQCSAKKIIQVGKQSFTKIETIENEMTVDEVMTELDKEQHVGR